jgi:hypothetical protein
VSERQRLRAAIAGQVPAPARVLPDWVRRWHPNRWRVDELPTDDVRIRWEQGVDSNSRRGGQSWEEHVYWWQVLRGRRLWLEAKANWCEANDVVNPAEPWMRWRTAATAQIGAPGRGELPT